jgi:hypothetical protein
MSIGKKNGTQPATKTARCVLGGDDSSPSGFPQLD